MISIEDLSFGYGKSLVIDHLNWQLEAGRVHGLVGMNGAGKTTLFNLIAGWLKPSEGKIRSGDAPVHQNGCGLMETNPFFYPMITGKEYLQVFKLKNKAYNIEAWNRIFKLPLDEVVDNYSTGMLKRLSLMGILALNREILILDEPFNGLDFEAVRQVQQIIPALALKGKTVIVSSHITESLTAICQSISLIREGKIDFTLQKEQFNGLEAKIMASGGVSVDLLNLPL